MLRRLNTFVSHGSIKDGKLVMNNDHYFLGMIQGFEDTNKVRITIEKERGTRSQNQNRYYWGVVLPVIAEHMGERVEDLHEVFKSRFLRKKRVWRGGEITILRSTSELTSDEFAEYLSQVIQEGAELGVVVPEADKEWVTHEQFPESVQ